MDSHTVTLDPDDAELIDLALAADPDAPLHDDAISIFEYLGAQPHDGLLPAWYMPAPMTSSRRGWRAAVVLLVIAAFVGIEAAGLCSTYGRVVFG